MRLKTVLLIHLPAARSFKLEILGVTMKLEANPDIIRCDNVTSTGTEHSKDIAVGRHWGTDLCATENEWMSEGCCESFESHVKRFYRIHGSNSPMAIAASMGVRTLILPGESSP